MSTVGASDHADPEAQHDQEYRHYQAKLSHASTPNGESCILNMAYKLGQIKFLACPRRKIQENR